MALRSGLGAMGALLMAGCAVPYSPAPLATNFPSSTQDKAQAAAHWVAITSHIEQELMPALKNSPNRPLFVAPAQATAFNQAVTAQLITSLVNDGQVVATTAKGSLKVDIDTQVVEFSRHRPQYKFSGERSAIAAGAWVLTSVQHTPQWMATVAVFGQDAYAWFHSAFASGETPKTEIIVTVSVSDEQRYFARSTSVYYVTDSDRSLYAAAPPPVVVPKAPPVGKTFTVRGDGA
jgi:hypothetical protein